MKLLGFHLFLLFIVNQRSAADAKSTSQIHLLDKTYENEAYYFDLAYLNSNYTSYESTQNRFSTRDRNGGAQTLKNSCNNIRQIPANIRNDLKLSYFYQKFTEAYGVPVIGSNKVSANGLRRACYVLRFFLASRAEFRDTFYKRSVRVVVMASAESLLNVPEFSSLPMSWSGVRGLSATAQIPLITIGEENVQCSSDKKRAEDLILHQFAFSVLSLDALEPQLKRRLEASYESAKSAGSPWRSSPFDLVDIKEYFASSVDIYLGASSRHTFDELKSRDQAISEVLKEIFTCENTYINKCKTSRESETLQVMKLGNGCEAESSSSSGASTPRTAFTEPVQTSNLPKYVYTPFYRPTTSSTSSSTRRHESLASTGVSAPLSFYQTPRTATAPFSRSTTLPYYNPQQIYSTTSSSSSYWPSESEKPNSCADVNENCASWSAKGECQRNRQFMNIECKKSCGLCDADKTTKFVSKTTTTTKIDLSIYEALCKDDFDHCKVFALRGDCKTNPHYMLDKCKRSCNLCGDLVQQKDRIQATTKKARRPSAFPFDSNNNNNYVQTTSVMIEPTAPPFAYNDYNRAKQPQTGPKFRHEYSPDQTARASVVATTTVPSQQQQAECADRAGHCQDLAARGDCTANEETMRYYCPKSCKFC